MTIEDRLRQAMQDETRHVEAHPAAWARVQDRVAVVRGRRQRRNVGIGVLATAAAVLVMVALVSMLESEGSQEVRVGPAGDPTTTVSPDAAPFPGIWPFASDAEVRRYVEDPGVGMFFDAEATALEFARSYLGMSDPVSSSGFVPSVDGSSGGVAVRSRPGSPMVTRIEVRRFGGDDGPWSVTGAETDNIQVDRPRPLDDVTNVVVVTGTSTAFEATVQVEVRQDGQGAGEALGRNFVMGGANGELAPFAGDLTIDPPTRPAGAVVFSTESAEDGGIQEASVVRVVFAEPGAEPSAALTRFSVFFHRGDEVVEFGRETGRTLGVLRAALESLFEGPQEHDGPGVSSLFSADTAGLLAGVSLRPDGTAVVDLADTVENASTSAGSEAMLAELDATVFQFSTVQRVEYRLRGSCEAFWNWLQRDGCQLVERSDG